MGNSREGGEGQEMALDKELERAAGEEMGEQIPGVAQEKDEAVKFSQLGMMDKTPIGLRFFPWEKSKGMIRFGDLGTEGPGILYHRRVANLYAPRG